MRLVVSAAICLMACADVTVLRYQASTTRIAALSTDHGHSQVARPARGATSVARLSDGFPVWVVHHVDGTISVISAVAPPRPQTAGYHRDTVVSQVDRSLVTWIPGVRRFSGGGILFDERGHALGYAGFDACFGDCPRIEDMPAMVRDLDTFVNRSQLDSSIEVGRLVEGRSRRRASTWLPWRRPAAREDDMRAADSPPMPRASLIAALALAEGDYAVVDGEAVRSTHAEPAICEVRQVGKCGACGADRLQLGGIAASDAAHIHRRRWWRDPAEYRRDRRAVYIEAEPGTFLVRRQRVGFQIVAGIFRGNCSGGS